MPLIQSPLHIFSSVAFEQGPVRLKLEMPWAVNWGIGALRTALAWELVASCEEHQQLIPRRTNEALNRLTNLKAEVSDYSWLDGTFSRNADRILERIGDDVLRLQPRPVVEMTGPSLDSETLETLNELGKYLDIIITYTFKPLPDTTMTDEAQAALCLLGSAGWVNASLGRMLITSAKEAGNPALAAALSRYIEEAGEGVRVFSAYDVSFDYQYLAPTLATVAQAAWPRDIPDWQDLGLPYLLKQLWTNPRQALDHLRSDSARQGKTMRNAFRVRLSIARHFLKCFSGEQGLMVRMDLLDASTALRNNQPIRAWQLLSPYTNAPWLLQDADLAAHVYGHAGQAAARLDHPQEALTLYQQNLTCLEQAFGVDTNQYRNALASLHHKLGQLLREHPELPGGFRQARYHLEQSLELHQALNRPSGVSMCLNELGKLAMAEGDFEKAKTWFEDALTLDRKNQNALGESRILHDLAILHERAGDFSQALDYVEQCEQVQQSAGIVGNLRQRLLNTRERLRDMLGLEGAGESESLVDILNRISSDEPRTFCTYVSQRSRTLRQQSRYADAEWLLLEALKRPIPEAQRQFLWLALANLLLDLRRHGEAREILDKIKPQSDRTKDELVLLKARLESQMENYAQAENLLAELSTHNQREVLGRVHFTRGQVLFQQNRFAEAAIEFREAREISQTSPYAMRLALEKEARSLLAAGEYLQAAKLAEELAKVAATGKWKLRQIRAGMIFGESLFRLGQAREAAEAFDRALALVQASNDSGVFPIIGLQRRAAQAWFNAGNAGAALARIQAAQASLEQEDAPLEQRGWVYHLAAFLHRASGSFGEYEAALQKAEQYAQSSGSKLLQQAVIILRQGDWRQDDWSMDDFEWEEEEDAPRAAVGRARRLRARLKLDEALKTLAPFEQAPVAEAIRREILELKLGMLLDLQERGNKIDLQATFAQLIAGRPDEALPPKLLLLRARAEILDRRYESAIATAQLAYQKGSDMGELYSIARAGALLTKALGEIGRPSEAATILQEIAVYMKAQGRHQFAFDAKYSLSRHLIFMREVAEARRHLQELAESSPQLNLADWARLQIAHAEIDRIEGKSELAIERLQEIFARVEEAGRLELRVEADRLYNAILLDRGLTRESLPSPANDRTDNLRRSKAANVQIKELRRSGRHREAIAMAERILEQEGTAHSRTRAIIMHEAALCYFYCKEVESAITLCRQSLDLHIELNMRSGTPGVRTTLARILSNQENAEAAQQQLLTALEENKSMGDQRGISICEKLLAQFSGQIPNTGRPETAREMMVRAHTLRHAHRMREATELYTQALQQAQAEQDVWAEAKARGALGLNSFYSGNLTEAVQHLEKAVELHAQLGSSSLGECVRKLSHAYVKLGRYEEARQTIEGALNHQLSDEERLELQHHLARLKRRR